MMKDSLPAEYEKGFLNKVKRFFYTLFKKKNKNEILKEEVVKETVNISNNSFERMKKLSRNEKVKNEILSMIYNDPQLLYSLTLEQINEVDKMCDNIIEMNNRKIAKLIAESN